MNDITFTGNQVIYIINQENILKQYLSDNIKIDLTQNHINTETFISVNTNTNESKSVVITIADKLSFNSIVKYAIVDKILLLSSQGYNEFKVIIDFLKYFSNNTSIKFDILYLKS